MNNYCTLFDSNFLSRGLALHNSLIRHEPDAHLYVYCFDEMVYEALNLMTLPNMTIIAMNEFETSELLNVKATRKRGEYCWTCTPHIIIHAIKKYQLLAITYLDADLYFYKSPKILIDEWEEADASILITEHRYTPVFENSSRFGIYCVQFVTFRADEIGTNALKWWAEKCLEWCYDREEDGKFGDQKYLDDWPYRFEKVHVLKHLGGGVAPWNVQQYAIKESTNKNIRLVEIAKEIEFDLIFYHFHGFQIYKDGEIDLSSYPLRQDLIKKIYDAYIEELGEVGRKINLLPLYLNFHGLKIRPISLKEKAKIYKRKCVRWFKGALNVRQVKDVIQLK